MKESQYARVGVDLRKKGIEIFRSSIQSMYPTAFCVIKQDPDLPGYAIVPHADSAGSKPVQNYLDFRETGNIESFKGIAQDVVAMNLDDIVCVGAKPVSFVDCVAINKAKVPKENLLKVLNSELMKLTETMQVYGVTLPFDGGETADVPDQISTLDVSGFMLGRLELSKVVSGDRIRPGNKIVGIRSGGRSHYEGGANSGIMCNGITLARHSLLSSEYEKKYPEIRGSGTLGYFGRFRIDEKLDELDMTVGQALTSPTRIFAPIIFKVLDELDSAITGLVHNTGGGLTKCLRLGRGIRYVKRDLPDPDPIFLLIKKESNETWQDMFQDFNMGVGFEVILEKEKVGSAIDIIDGFGVESRVIGEIESGPSGNQLIIDSKFGEFTYEGPCG